MIGRNDSNRTLHQHTVQLEAHTCALYKYAENSIHQFQTVLYRYFTNSVTDNIQKKKNRTSIIYFGAVCRGITWRYSFLCPLITTTTHSAHQTIMHPARCSASVGSFLSRQTAHIISGVGLSGTGMTARMLDKVFSALSIWRRKMASSQVFHMRFFELILYNTENVRSTQ